MSLRATREWRSSGSKTIKIAGNRSATRSIIPRMVFIIPRWAPPLVGEAVMAKFGKRCRFSRLCPGGDAVPGAGGADGRAVLGCDSLRPRLQWHRLGPGDLGPENGASVSLISNLPNWTSLA